MNIWKFIQGKLSHKTEVMLMVVAESSGSSPGRPGFKMAVTKNKELFGSIGGGGMEYQMVELCCELLNSGNSKPFYRHQVHSEVAGNDKSGSICSGAQTIICFPIDYSHLKIIKNIALAGENAPNGVIKITNKSFEFLPNEKMEISCKAEIKSEDDWAYFEKPGKIFKICIIGAGHVGLALSKMMRELDFIVEIYDDRLGLNTFENNEYVNKKSKVDYNRIDRMLPEGDNIYVVIMTFGHQSDELVLEKIMDMNFKYIGMMGSKAKVNRIFKNIGFNPETSEKKIYAPIGLPINSQTPDEIAISIAAEIIKIKNSEE